MRARSEATRDVHSGLLSMLGSKTTLAVVRELSWGILGRGEGGAKGIGVSGSGYNEVPALGCYMWLIKLNGRDVRSFRSLHQLITLSLWRCRSRRACVRACVYAWARMCMACSECYMHFGTGVLGTGAWAGVYVTQVCFLHQHTHL